MIWFIICITTKAYIMVVFITSTTIFITSIDKGHVQLGQYHKEHHSLNLLYFSNFRTMKKDTFKKSFSLQIQSTLCLVILNLKLN